MSIEAQGPLLRRRAGLNVDIAALLTFGAFVALVFGSYYDALAAWVFLLCGAGLLVTDVGGSLRALVRWWFLLLLPAYCIVSTLWSDYAQLTLRYSIQLTLTLAIAILMARRLKPDMLLRCLFAAFALGTLFSVPMSLQAHSDAAWQGIFGSKNAFAAHVAFFFLVSLALCLDRHASRALRFTALASAILCCPLLVLAHSAGVLLTIVPSAAVMLLVAASVRMTDAQKLFAIALTLLAMAAVGLLVLANEGALLNAILDATGKDATLTGRTDLWAAGGTLIAEHPLFGVGYRGFWVVGNATAEQLWGMFHLEPGAGFNFHNTYISNTVDLGLVGMSLQLIVIYGALLMLVWLAAVRPSAFVIFLLGSQILLVLRSFIEVEVFTEFNIRSMMAICTFIYAAYDLIDWRRHRRGALRARLRRVAPGALPDASEGAGA